MCIISAHIIYYIIAKLGYNSENWNFFLFSGQPTSELNSQLLEFPDCGRNDDLDSKFITGADNDSGTNVK
jgi:hypothetical protein